MSRKVIASPFQFAGTSPSSDNIPSSSPSVPVVSNNVPVQQNTSSSKYAPPPSVQQLHAENKINKDQNQNQNQNQNNQYPTNTLKNPLEQYPTAQGGKLSVFAELSNKKPPQLFDVGNSNIQSPTRNTTIPRPIDPKQYTSINSPTKLIPNQNQDPVEIYQTNTNSNPPPAAREFCIKDEGNCGPRYMRCSTYNIPSSVTMAKELNIKLGLVIQPLADPLPGDTQIPVIRPHKSIIRCTRCGSFHNSLDKYIKQGHSFVCFLCNFENSISDEDYSPLSMEGTRLDIQNHPELQFGSIEYIAPPEYISKPPFPLSVVFVIETTYKAYKSGVIQALKDSLSLILPSIPKNSTIRFGFVTFTNTMQFYSFSANRNQLQIFTLPDIDNIALPLQRDELLGSYHKSSSLFDKFFELLPKLCQENEQEDENGVCTASAIRTAGMILKDISGKIVLVQSSMPSLGPGSITNRLKGEIIGTPNERKLYYPAESYYKEMATDCCNHGIGFDLFVIGHGKYIDVASLAPLVKVTGGELYYYSQFNYSIDRIKLHNDLFNLITKTNGLTAICKIRASAGVEIDKYYGNFQLKYDTEMHYSTISNNSMSCVYFNLTDPIPNNTLVGFQCVLLYTTSFGEKRIRIHSLQIPSTQQIGKAFSSIDLDSLLYLNAVSYWQECKQYDLKKVRENVLKDCFKSLLSFRKNCASNDIGLAVPDSLRLYPIYQLSLLKSSLLFDGIKNIDYRITEWVKIFHLPLSEFSIYLYPKMFSLHNLEEHIGTQSSLGSIILPPWEKLSKENLLSNGCYLIENSDIILIWVGRSVSPKFLQEVFGLDSLLSSQVLNISLNQPENGRTINQIHTIINEIRSKKSHYLNMFIIPQGSSRESVLMKEDRIGDTMSHMDLLSYLNMHIAKQVKQ